MKFGMGDPNVLLFNLASFMKTRTESHAFLVGVNGITFTRGTILHFESTALPG